MIMIYDVQIRLSHNMHNEYLIWVIYMLKSEFWTNDKHEIIYDKNLIFYGMLTKKVYLPGLFIRSHEWWYCECVYAYVLVMTMACPLDELYTAWNEKWLLTPRSNAISQKRKNKQTNT